MTLDRVALEAALVRDEGLRLRPYRDTVGALTIGVGRNLDAVGISTDEAYYLLGHDIDRAVHACVNRFPWFVTLDPVRQGVLVQMAFNLGIAGLEAFVQTLAAVERGDYATAAHGMLQSRWATQVGDRATRLAAIMVSGVLP